MRFVMLGFTCISSCLTTHGHSALVTLGLESHALATFCSKSCLPGRVNSRSMLSPVLLDVHFMMDICDEDADDDGG